MRKHVMLWWSLGFAPLAPAAPAAIDDPAALSVQSLDISLLNSMRAGSGLGSGERYEKLQPVIERVFDLPLMTRLSIGPAWVNFSAEQQQAAIAAFTRLTIAGYAHNFREYNGQEFNIKGPVASRGTDKIVQVELISAHDSPVGLTYRLRELNGVWKIIDVSYGEVSQLTLQRSDFSSAVTAGGAPVLLAHMKQLSDDLMKP